MSNSHITFMRVALVCIAKNEDNYIEEWLDYHRKLGFDHFFIYQNNWRFNKDFTDVTKFKFDGYLQQLKSYNHFISSNYWNWDWVAFFDVDEFLVLKKHNNIKDFLIDYNDFNAVGINWVYFGDNNLSEVTEWSVIKRFTMRQSNPYRAIKSIVRLSKGGNSPKFINNPHNINLDWVDTHKRINTGPSTKEPSDDIAQLNHYYCKTIKEFRLKCERGRACSQNILTDDDFKHGNYNEVEDITALKLFIR